MSAYAHAHAIAASSAAGWQPSMATSGTPYGSYLIRPDLLAISGGEVSSVANRLSGGSNPLVQPLTSATQRPTYEATGWNGKPSILFNGTTNFMHAHGLATLVASGTDTPFTIVMTAQLLTIGVVSGNNRALWCFGNSGTDTPLCGATILDGTTNGAISRRDDASTLRQRAQATALTTNRATYTHRFTGNRGSLRINGIQDSSLDGVTSPSAELDVGALTLNTFSVGCAVRSTAAWLTHMRLGGMLVFAGALSDADCAKAEAYLLRSHPL